jgi:Tol biopolymer transport system component
VVVARTGSSVLVYSCGTAFENLCQINPDGSGRGRLTSDGRSAPSRRYASPSLSRDGSKLAYLRGYELFVLNRSTGRKTGPISKQAELARISADGRKVGDLENFVSVESLAVCTFAISGQGRECVGTTGSFGFAGEDRVLASVSAGAEFNYDKGICVLALDGSGCERYVVSDAAHDIWDPAVSPNGRLLAATLAAKSEVEGSIVIYEYPTGRLVRQLTAGPHDSAPVWSSDGSRLAFARNASSASASIYTIAANGRPGDERRLVAHARAATWGGAPRRL